MGNVSSLKIYDSRLKQKVVFEPQTSNQASVYVCGPTVYDDAHLGHGRSAVVFDLLHRVLKANGYSVTFVKNYTDIDDKIIKKMQTTNQSLQDITSFYIQSYQDDMRNLNVLDNTITPKATEHIDDMIELVEVLLDANKAYILSDGVYLDTTSDDKYGDISHRVSDEHSVARVDENIEKKNPQDFALWKFAKEGDNENVVFRASFGDGRPGWHCECSAMIHKHLSKKENKYSVDIHAGGSDLLFPHHENEACQTRSAYNQEIAKYWMHNGFVNINGEKMSKSLGNSFFLKDVFKLYHPEAVRFYMLNTHYRANFGFSDTDLMVCKKRLDKLYRLKKKLLISPIEPSCVDETFKSNILASLNDDLNTSQALAIIDEFIQKSNEFFHSTKNKNELKAYRQCALANIEFVSATLGFGGMRAYEYFQFGVSDEIKQKINTLLKKREQARANKDYKLSDEIRDELASMNISISDSYDGVVWERV